jgi:hypothetical protein
MREGGRDETSIINIITLIPSYDRSNLISKTIEAQFTVYAMDQAQSDYFPPTVVFFLQCSHFSA